MLKMNSSTLGLIKKSLPRWQSRLALLHKRTALLCTANREHGVQTCVDFRPLRKTVVLMCGCERETALVSADGIAAYEAARREHAKRVEIVGKNQPTNWGTVHRYVETQEAAC